MEHARFTSHGGLSVRSIFMLVVTVVVTVFLWAILVSTPTHAADPAHWKGEAVIYQDNTYNGPADKQTLKDLGLPEGVKAYVFVDPTPTQDSTNTDSNSSPPSRQIHVIYFDVDGDMSDGVNNLSDVTTAKYRDYTYVARGDYKNPSAIEQISISPKTATGTTSCAIDGGLGWIICPISNTLATAMDSIYSILTGFLAVRPIETGQDNALYRSWKFMQAFANIAFVVAFLVIIYSQLTSVGIGSYGIKKLLPRLIIAALLVNVSYFICSIAVDVSNVLGYSLQDIFMGMRNSLVGSEGNGWETVNWASLTGAALSGGTAAIGGGTALFLAVSDFGPTVIFLILPALVIALLAVLVALLVMAARQAIIVVLIILAPLAFVAYLLPNTEKWFEKWRETFVTMLFLFPAFSVVFGGSQLASMVIIQSADSINLIILGMLVQVAPLIITPLLVRLGGSLLARIAGIVNDPKRGIIDRTRNFTKDRMENHKARRLGPDARGWQVLKRNAQWREANRRKREGWKAAHTSMTDARWANSPQFERIDQASRYAAEDKEEGEKKSELTYERSRMTDNRVRNLDLRRFTTEQNLEAAKNTAETQRERSNDRAVLQSRLDAQLAADTLAVAKQQFESQIEDLRGGTVHSRFAHIPNIISHTALTRDALENKNLLASHIANAQAHQQQEFATMLKHDAAGEGLKVAFAGGILEHGATKALASANIVIDHAMEEAIKNIQTTIDIPAGDVGRLRAELDIAFETGDLAASVAYANKLAESQNAGVMTLRAAIRDAEVNTESFAVGSTLRKDFKQYMNANQLVNVAAEDIGTWSREPDGNTTLVQTAENAKMWNEMTPIAFSSMKKSSQLWGMLAGNEEDGWGVDQDMAKEILRNPTSRANLKKSVRKKLEYLAETGNRPTITEDELNIPDDEDFE